MLVCVIFVLQFSVPPHQTSKPGASCSFRFDGDFTRDRTKKRACSSLSIMVMVNTSRRRVFVVQRDDEEEKVMFFIHACEQSRVMM